MSSILYFIANLEGVNTGKGGHYHSLLVYAKALSEAGNFVTIVSIGRRPIDIYQETGLDYYNISGDTTKLFSELRRLRTIIRSSGATNVHAFDKSSTFYAQIASYLFNLKITVTKCGGPNPRWFPEVKDIILFSKENFEWFEHSKKHRNSRLWLIPNRVEAFNVCRKRVNALIERYQVNLDVPIILCVARISRQNEKRINGAIKLCEYLNAVGINCTYMIVGHLEDDLYFKEINGVSSAPGVLVTNPEFTSDAKDYVSIAFAVVGSGRSLMEAAFLKKPVLVPVDSGTFPSLLTEDNFNNAFNVNFSSRYFDENDDEVRVRSIKRLFMDSSCYYSACEFSYEKYQSYFSINTVVDKILNIYSGSEKTKGVLDISMSFLYYLLEKKKGKRNTD